MIKRFSSILNSSIGNILEWYDFGLFSIFSSLFSRLFFPTEDPKVAIIATFSIFAIGFFCRPIGGLIFGYLGDKKGRAKTLRLSILMIALPTLFIGLLPTYTQVGMAAPIALLLIRMWQGISIGGEYSGSLVYLAETAPSQHRALTTSFASAGSNVGILLAAFVGVVCTLFLAKPQLYTWGWRLPYLISGILSLLIYWFRLRIQETPVFIHMKEARQIKQNPIVAVFKNNLPELLRTFGMVCMGSTFYYFCFTYLPLLVAQVHTISLRAITSLMTGFIALMVVLIPLAGILCDRVGRRKLLLFNASLVALIIIPGFYLLQFNYFIVIIVFTIFTIATSLEQGTTAVAVVENFPSAERYLGVAVSYNIANGFLGGTVPVMCTWLAIQKLPLLPAIYICSFALITLAVVYFFVPETKNKSLMV